VIGAVIPTPIAGTGSMLPHYFNPFQQVDSITDDGSVKITN
jgi:hypothetical protein